MATGHGTERATEAPAVVLNDPAFLREPVTRTLPTVLEEELTAHLRRRARRAERRAGERHGHKRRTQVVRIFPNRESLLRLVTTLAREQSEEWISGRR